MLIFRWGMLYFKLRTIGDSYFLIEQSITFFKVYQEISAIK